MRLSAASSGGATREKTRPGMTRERRVVGHLAGRGREQRDALDLRAEQLGVGQGQVHDRHPAHRVPDQHDRPVAGHLGEHLAQVLGELRDPAVLRRRVAGPAVRALVVEHLAHPAAEVLALVEPAVHAQGVAVHEHERRRVLRQRRGVGAVRGRAGRRPARRPRCAAATPSGVRTRRARGARQDDLVAAARGPADPLADTRCSSSSPAATPPAASARTPGDAAPTPAPSRGPARRARGAGRRERAVHGAAGAAGGRARARADRSRGERRRHQPAGRRVQVAARDAGPDAGDDLVADGAADLGPVGRRRARPARRRRA